MTSGFVSIVGAGPGDPAYLTLKGAERLRQAQVVFHDALVDRRVLALAPQATHIPVGKRAGAESTPQARIHELLIGAAQRGFRIVRLKGGDPCVFGRGGEEALALRAAGVPFEIVPGVSSAIAAPELAGIPVTQRGLAAGFVVLTGANAETCAAAVKAIAPHSLTLVFLMSLHARGQIARSLIDRGWAPTTPAAIIVGAASPEMWKWVGGLGDIEAVAIAAASEHLAGTIVIGAVAGLAIDSDHPVLQENVFA